MKAFTECIPCVFRQVLDVAKKVAPDNPWLQRQVMNRVMTEFPEIDFDRSPAEVSFDCLMVAHKKLGVKDPYKKEKQSQNDSAIAILEKISASLSDQHDSLETAVKLSLAGNIIDLGIMDHNLDVDKTISDILDSPLAINDFEVFKDRLNKARSALYILDNAGEIVFDKFLMEQLGRNIEITAVVRRVPILNDVTNSDAEYIALDKLADITDPGVECFGIPLHKTSAEFQELFQTADMVISKGQANYETLENNERDIFFLMMAKCDCIANHLGVKKMSPVLIYKGKEIAK